MRGIDALCGKVVQFLKVRIHDNLLFVGVFKRLNTRQRAVSAGDGIDAARQAREVSAQKVKEYGFGNVVCVVSSGDLVGVKKDGAAVESLSSKYSAKGAVGLMANEADNFVHSPPVQVAIVDDKQREPILHFIPVDGSQTIVAIA